MTEAQLGQLLALAGGFFFAAGSVFVSRSTIRSGDRGVLFSVLVTMAFALVLWLAFEGISVGDVQADAWWRGVFWFAVAGLAAMVFGRTLAYASIRQLGVTRASAVKRLNPFFTVLLAAVFLAEPIGGQQAVGIVVIALAFGLLIQHSMRTVPAAAGPGGTIGLSRHAPTDYGWGIGAALAYASAYITRRHGLGELPAPAFGTLVSAVTGFVAFAGMALVNERMRDNFLGIFRNLDKWLVLAAVFVSLGQITLFTALFYERASIVALIASLEVFIAAFLAVVVFKTEARPDQITVLAAVSAVIGAMIIATG